MKICIIGGGTTGWMAAAYIEKYLPEVNVTLIESSTIPTIGVGESSLPQLRNFFNDLGIDDKTWVSDCNGVLKKGSEKICWNGGTVEEDKFKFKFWYNRDNQFDDWLQTYLKGNVNKENLNNELYDPDGWQSYAYHLDAEKIPTVLKKHTKNINHIIKTLDDLPNGYDLYLDCTGFNRKFVKNRKFIDLTKKGHILNSAWVQAFELKTEPYNYTKSIALNYGWQFNIHTREKNGAGYVFCSDMCSEKKALEEFLNFNKQYNPYQGSNPRLLRWKSGFLENPWNDNVVALGLAGGFIEPQESNALYLIQYSITSLVKCIKRGYKSKVYNKIMKNIWLHNSDFLLHLYKLSPRKDTEFWKYYIKEDSDISLWKNYIKFNDTRKSLYHSAMWANIGVLYDEFNYYGKIIND